MQTRLQAGVGYGNTLSCIRTVYGKESVFGFFKGMSFPLASIAVYNSVVFGVFSNTQRFLSQHQSREPEAGQPHTLSSLLLASVAAGVVSVGLGTPVDLIKIRLQMQTQPFRETNLSVKPRAVALGEWPAYQGPVHCIATIVRTEGLVGLYRGASAMLLRDVPGYCLYFIPYVFVSDWITPEACSEPSPYTVWLAGGTAGAISWGTATPMDVVKSRLQADGVYLNKYKGVLDCISQSYQKDGLKGQGWCHLTRAASPQLQGGCGHSRSCESQNPCSADAKRSVLALRAGATELLPGKDQCSITVSFRSALASGKKWGDMDPAPHSCCKLPGNSQRSWSCL
ncbi:solute carrier family 25 member 48 isoform X2 [Phyllostomus hastatus]|uniref:solute carrier family 25 member 48 isoform X2 n=1 Tax=Phyllostomus hastatus TaxID=9423 RepID=UPI001E681C5C|nr:solute carrier family 25 member 48 isoform X2 [Phyllostomus hastatus]XP_045681398.1 solute carrier family 25 member 48 isoform X2 [Phyllostomus hastatus]XP_045681407.1 solute carrier family 25 member 48 isoform X2 [Phyllostomus hastatus]